MKWRCPICRKETDSDQDEHFPFCSERCRLLDLGNWASEKYKVSEPAADESALEEGSNMTRSQKPSDQDDH